MTQKPNIILPILLAVACVFVGGLVWYFFLRGGVPKPEFVSPQPLTTDASPGTLAAASAPPPGFVEYQNDRYGFSFYHPKDATISTFDEGGGATTVVLQSVDQVRGLQVFIVPYKGDSITEDRFHKDDPSGVRTNETMTTISPIKVPAVAFNSQDPTLGTTFELWFIHGGYLYEMTTFSGTGDWLAPIVQTWQFTS
jgi:hypothetical protein